MANHNGAAEPHKVIDTGYRIVRDQCNGITGPEHDFEFWFGSDNYIWGPINAARYRLDEQGNIILGGSPTGFFVENDRIYGPPGKGLPWLD